MFFLRSYRFLNFFLHNFRTCCHCNKPAVATRRHCTCTAHQIHQIRCKKIAAATRSAASTAAATRLAITDHLGKTMRPEKNETNSKQTQSCSVSAVLVSTVAVQCLSVQLQCSACQCSCSAVPVSTVAVLVSTVAVQCQSVQLHLQCSACQYSCSAMQCKLHTQIFQVQNAQIRDH